MRRSQEMLERKLPIKTSFGPEEGKNVVVSILNKKLENQQVVKEVLDDQIYNKADSAMK